MTAINPAQQAIANLLTSPGQVQTAQQAGDPRVPGMIAAGNIDLGARSPILNDDGSVSTIRSVSFSTPQGEVLVPTVVGGRVVSDREAWDHFLKTAEHLGVFQDPASADAYAQSLHEMEAKRAAFARIGSPNMLRRGPS